MKVSLELRNEQDFKNKMDTANYKMARAYENLQRNAQIQLQNNAANHGVYNTMHDPSPTRNLIRDQRSQSTEFLKPQKHSALISRT